MARRETALWLADAALPAAGFGLLLIGALAMPSALPLAWLALGLAFIGWVAEADGLPLPRPGRLAIQTYGCWETPLGFSVCRDGRELVFCREENEHGAWAAEYTVRERPRVRGADFRFEMPVGGSGWTLLGRAPVAVLRFERRERVSYVTRRSLEAALAHTRGVTS